MEKKTLVIIFGIVILSAVGYFAYQNYYKMPTGNQQAFVDNTNTGGAGLTTPSENGTVIKYTNDTYGFEFALPDEWKGYYLVEEKWEGYAPSDMAGQVLVAEGPQLSVRHPLWTNEKPRQDIPVMVFTLVQWDDMSADKFHIGAAPINPTELARNNKYVFALPARYNFAFPEGYEEVDHIIVGSPLHAFDI